MLTSSLAIVGLLFNLTVLALGFSLDFLGLLNTVSFASAAVLSVPLLWLVTRVSLRSALLASAALQIASVLILALVPFAPALLISGGLTGTAAVLFQVSAPPFMMRQSDAATRDHLFSANAAILIGFAGLGSLIGGRLPGLAAQLFGVAAESGLRIGQLSSSLALDWFCRSCHCCCCQKLEVLKKLPSARTKH